MASLASVGALAQGTDGARQKLDACMLPTYAERMACLDKLAGEASTTTPPPLVGVPSSVPGPATAGPVLAPLTAARTQAPAPAAGKWIISETRSPVDYSPVLIATASSGAGPAGMLQLSIECRAGRTEMVIRSAPLMRRAADHVVSYSINDAPPVAVTSGLSGGGIALKGDVAGFLKSLPADGVIAFRVAERQGGTLEGRYDLPGIKALAARMVGPCKWPRN